VALASKWLRETLSHGPMQARYIFAMAQAAVGVSEHTLRRAARDLPITIRRDKQGQRLDVDLGPEGRCTM